MNITKYIPSIHNWYVDQGEYKCKDCEGDGEIQTTQMGMDGAQYCHKCIECNGTGKHKNTGELLAEIAGLLVGDALRAYKIRCFAFFNVNPGNNTSVDDWLCLKKNKTADYFEVHVRDTFEDYIAQAFIKLFDFAGYLEMDLYTIDTKRWIQQTENIHSRIYLITKSLPYVLNKGGDRKHFNDRLSEFFCEIYLFCKDKNIPIEKHIDARLQYVGVKA